MKISFVDLDRKIRVTLIIYRVCPYKRYMAILGWYTNLSHESQRLPYFRVKLIKKHWRSNWILGKYRCHQRKKSVDDGSLCVRPRSKIALNWCFNLLNLWHKCTWTEPCRVISRFKWAIIREDFGQASKTDYDFDYTTSTTIVLRLYDLTIRLLRL